MDEKQLQYEFLSILSESHPGLTFEEYRDSCVFLLFYQYLCLKHGDSLEETYKPGELVKMAIRGKLQVASFLKFMESASSFLHLLNKDFQLTEFSFYKSLERVHSLEKQKSYEEDGVVGMGECADPDECKTIADLGVDMLAAGIGNIHGKYPANWQGLSFETLDAIQAKTGVMPLVLHGGTGIPADMIKKAISLGVSKINVNTECQLSFADATRKYIEAGKDLEGKGFDPRKLLAPGADAIKATVKEKMELFGSVGKAE